MAIFILSVIAAVVPALIYVALIYSVDRYEKEPKGLLIATFLWGAVPSIILAIIISTIFSIPFYAFDEGLGDAVSAIGIAPIVEESIKGLAILGILWWWRHELDSPLDGIIYGAMVGMGFAMVENTLYFLSVYDEGGVAAWGTNIFLRAIVFGLNHSLYTSMTGLGIAIARLSPNGFVRFFAPIGGWTLAVIIHAIHNLSALEAETLCILLIFNDFGGILLILGIIAWSLWQEGKWIRTYLVDEVAQGVLIAEQQNQAAALLGRNFHLLAILFSQGLGVYRQTVRFYYKCAELAYKKHHYQLFQHGQDLERAGILRAEITTLSQQLGS